MEPLNTLPIESFIQLVKTADTTNQKEIRMDIRQAKALSFALGTVMSRLNGDLESMMAALQETQTITVSMDAGNTW